MFGFHAALTPIDEHDHLVDATAGPDGAMVALWVTAAGAATLTAGDTGAGGASFPRSRTAQPVSARVVAYAPDIRAVVPITELTIGSPTVQMFPDGAVLVVGRRCRWSPEGAEHNAAIYGPDGTLERTGVLGDGVEHVAVSSAGDIWVGYFDEGVFGSYGWGGPGPAPIGSAGLVRFDRALQPVAGLADASMADCYALNVDGDTAWAYYYTKFPIARIADGATSIWKNPGSVAGAKALAVAGDRVALYGGYRGHATRLVSARLVGNEFHVEQTTALSVPRAHRRQRTALTGEATPCTWSSTGSGTVRTRSGDRTRSALMLVEKRVHRIGCSLGERSASAPHFGHTTSLTPVGIGCGPVIRRPGNSVVELLRFRGPGCDPIRNGIRGPTVAGLPPPGTAAAAEAAQGRSGRFRHRRSIVRIVARNMVS